jgi:hypothetical protein
MYNIDHRIYYYASRSGYKKSTNIIMITKRIQKQKQVVNRKHEQYGDSDIVIDTRGGGSKSGGVGAHTSPRNNG